MCPPWADHGGLRLETPDVHLPRSSLLAACRSEVAGDFVCLGLIMRCWVKLERCLTVELAG